MFSGAPYTEGYMVAGWPMSHTFATPRHLVVHPMAYPLVHQGVPFGGPGCTPLNNRVPVEYFMVYYMGCTIVHAME